VHFATDEDGNLKIKQIDEFRDSTAHLRIKQDVAVVMAANKK
jgi:hypothetical protein